MERKNLPIKIVEKRKIIDDRLTEGGGGDHPLPWILSGSELQQRSSKLTDELSVAESKAEMSFRKYKGLPTVLKAKVQDDALAKSHRSDMTGIFASDGDERVFGFSDEQELLIRVDNANEFKKFNGELTKLHKHQKGISALQAIKLHDPKINLEGITPNKDGSFSLKIRLIDFSDSLTNNAVLKAFQSELSKSNRLKLEKTVRISESQYLHEVTTASLDGIDDISDFTGIASIEPMPFIDVLSGGDFFNSDAIMFPAPQIEQDYPLAGILDSGIAPIPELSDWIANPSRFREGVSTDDVRQTNYPDHFLDTGHGTFVAGIVAFGDLLQGETYSGVSGCQLFDAAVIPDKSMERISIADLADNVREAIEKYKDKVKVWNMSLGTTKEASANAFSELGMALDNIQDEAGVLIIKSAGNCANYEDGLPVSRIAEGADSVRCITVGSVAHTKSDIDLAEPKHRSPFSRIGPGPANIVKPELVHVGGNSGLDNGTRVDSGIISLHKDGGLIKHIGTSFSTPRVTSIAADLESKLDGNFDPLMIKALLIHSASYPQDVKLTPENRLNHFGFGLPSPASDILFNDDFEITMAIRDTLPKGEFIEILDFPYPDKLIDAEGNYRGEIIVTVINKPILAPGQASEYCQSDLEVMFGTYNRKITRDMTKPTIRNPIGREGQKNLLSKSLYSKKRLLTVDGKFAAPEKLLVQYGDKFYPTKKYVLNLSDMTDANKKSALTSPKKWFLKVTGLYRDFITKKAIIEDFDLEQEFCIMVTIRDPQRTVPVYQEVSNLLDVNNFIHYDIALRQNVRIMLDGN